MPILSRKSNTKCIQVSNKANNSETVYKYFALNGKKNKNLHFLCS